MVRATRIARKIHKRTEEGKRIYLKHARAMLSRLGWFKNTDTYDIYERRVKPFIKVKKLKRIIAIADRRKRNAGLEKRNERYRAAAA